MRKQEDFFKHRGTEYAENILPGSRKEKKNTILKFKSRQQPGPDGG